MPSPRFFAFGCSFTMYNYPTWADIIGQSFDYYQNWGKIGGGNQFIANSLVECHLKNHIRPEDTVGIMWTNVSREDRYVNGQWLLPGNIYTQPHYPTSFVKKFADTRGYYIRDLATIFLVQKFLDGLGCKYFFLSMVDMTNPGQYLPDDASDSISDLLVNYGPLLDSIRPSVHKVIFNYDWSSRPWQKKDQTPSLDQVKSMYNTCAGQDWPEFEDFIYRRNLENISKKILDEIMDSSRWNWDLQAIRAKRTDTHPTPLEHLEYLEKILPEYLTDSAIVDLLEEIEYLLKIEQSYNHLLKKFNKQSFTRW